MKISLIIKRIILSSAVVASLLAPSFSATTVSATQTMDDMGHAKVDIANCLERHQTPTAPINKDIKQLDNEDKDEPTPPEVPYFVAFQKKPVEPEKPKVNLIESSSFVPPDIIILTAKLRI